MLLAYYWPVGGLIVFAFVLPLLVSLILHAVFRRYLVVILSTSIVTFVVWMILGVLCEPGITDSFMPILFITVSTAFMSAIAGIPFALVRLNRPW